MKKQILVTLVCLTLCCKADTPYNTNIARELTDLGKLSIVLFRHQRLIEDDFKWRLVGNKSKAIVHFAFVSASDFGQKAMQLQFNSDGNSWSLEEAEIALNEESARAERPVVVKATRREVSADLVARWLKELRNFDRLTPEEVSEVHADSYEKTVVVLQFLDPEQASMTTRCLSLKSFFKRFQALTENTILMKP